MNTDQAYLINSHSLARFCIEPIEQPYFADFKINNFKKTKLGNFLCDHKGRFYYSDVKSVYLRDKFNLLANYLVRQGCDKDTVIKYGNHRTLMCMVWNGKTYKSYNWVIKHD